MTCTLSVDATTLPADYLKRLAGRYTSLVWMFDLADSPIANRYQVAAYLFPKVTYDGLYEG
jgi:hypothetical protein